MMKYVHVHKHTASHSSVFLTYLQLCLAQTDFSSHTPTHTRMKRLSYSNQFKSNPVLDIYMQESLWESKPPTAKMNHTSL